MSVLVPGTIWMPVPLPARLMPQPSSRPEPAAFQTTVPLTGMPLASFFFGEWTTPQTIKPAVTAITARTAMAFRGLSSQPPGRWLTGADAAGGVVLAARAVLGGAGGFGVGGFGAAPGGLAGAPGARDSS